MAASIHVSSQQWTQLPEPISKGPHSLLPVSANKSVDVCGNPLACDAHLLKGLSPSPPLSTVATNVLVSDLNVQVARRDYRRIEVIACPCVVVSSS